MICDLVILINNFIRLLSVKMWNYQVPGGACLKKSVHQRMLVEQDLQLCSTLVSGLLASSYTATHSLQFTPLECTMTLYNIATHPFNAHHPMRHNFFIMHQILLPSNLSVQITALQFSEVKSSGAVPKQNAALHRTRLAQLAGRPQNAHVEILATFATKML